MTDGEEQVGRSIEKKCICRKGRIENEWGVDEECPRCTGEEITPDPYEECANELDPLPETIQGMEVVVDHKKVIEILKKYLQPKQ